MYRLLWAVSLALLVVTAGCQTGTAPATDGGSALSDTSTRTQTPSPTPTASASLDDVSYPTGADESGFENASAVMRTTRTVLDDTNFTVRFDATRTSPDGSTKSATFRGRETDQRAVTSFDGLDAPATIALYRAHGVVLARQQRAGSTEYRYSESHSVMARTLSKYNMLFAGHVPEEYLKAFEYDVTDSYREGGHTYLVYESTSVNESFVERSDTPDYDAGNLTVTLRGDGVVTDLEGETESSLDDGTKSEQIEFAVEDVGDTTVEKPDWVDGVTSLETTTGEDGRVIELTHTGGPAIEDATLTVNRGYENGDVTLTSLEAGESVYLTATGDSFDLNVTLSTTRPTPGAEAIDFTNASSATVDVETDSYEAYLAAYRNESADS